MLTKNQTTTSNIRTGFIGLLLAGTALSACASYDTSSSYPENWPILSAETPAAVGVAPEDVEALEAALSRYVDEGEVIGVASLWVKDGEVVSYLADGRARVRTDEPIDEDTIYRIYSMTKPVTGVALMMLYEEGKCELDDPITDHIPEFANLVVLDGTNEDGSVKTVPMERAPTMRELMSHTAGFAYGLGGMDAANQAFRDQNLLQSPDLQTFIDKVAQVPLLSQPGEQWYYSAAVDIQGYLVEKFSGQSFGSFLDERLFTPLGMDDTGFFVPDEDLDRFTDLTVWSNDYNTLVPIPTPSVQFTKDTLNMESGGGGLVSTLSDYARFCQMMLNEGEFNGARILKPETVELMTTNVLTGDQRVTVSGELSNAEVPPIGFGLDFAVALEDLENGTSEGSYYWGGAAGTWFWIDPEEDMFFIGMIQLFRGDKPRPDFREESAVMVYDALNK